jgi:hypothetical protein
MSGPEHIPSPQSEAAPLRQGMFGEEIDTIRDSWNSPALAATTPNKNRADANFRGSLVIADISRAVTFTAFPLDDMHNSLRAGDGPADPTQRLETPADSAETPAVRECPFMSPQSARAISDTQFVGIQRLDCRPRSKYARGLALSVA